MTNALPREIAPDVFWLGDCLGVMVSGTLVHGYSSIYLIRGSDRSLLVDTGYPADWGVVSRSLAQLLGQRSLDFIVPTHPEFPHAGCLRRLMATYPESVAVGDMRDYHLYYPEYTTRMRPMAVGSRIELGGGLEVELLDALIKDMPNVIWAYERSRRVLFVADGFSYMHRPNLADDDDEAEPYHLPGECNLMVSELAELPSLDNAKFFMGISLYWTRYLDRSDEIFARLARLLETHPTNLVAPAHGSVIDEFEYMVQLMAQAQKAAFPT